MLFVFFCNSVRGGTRPPRREEQRGHGAGPGTPWGSSSALGLAQVTRGFSVRAQEPGTLLPTPRGPGRGSAPGWRCRRLAERRLRGSGPGPVAHAHCPGLAPRPCSPPPDNHLLPSPLVAFTIFSSAPWGAQRRLPLPCPSSAPAGQVRNVSLAATSPSLWTRAGLGRGRGRRGKGSWPQGPAPGPGRRAGGSGCAPSPHLTSTAREPPCPSCGAARGLGAAPCPGGGWGPRWLPAYNQRPPGAGPGPFTQLAGSGSPGFASPRPGALRHRLHQQRPRHGAVAAVGGSRGAPGCPLPSRRAEGTRC